MKDDTISRQAAIDAIMGEPPETHYPSWYAEQIKELPSADNEVGRPEEPNKLGLRNCPFCGKEAKVKIYGHAARTRRIDGEETYFAVTYKLGCFDCGMVFTYESQFEAREDGSIETVLNGFRHAADKWNGRGEE